MNKHNSSISDCHTDSSSSNCSEGVSHISDKKLKKYTFNYDGNVNYDDNVPDETLREIIQKTDNYKIQHRVNNDKVQINEFTKDFCQNPAILMIGKRAAGKTQLCIDIMQELYNTKKVDEFIVISPNDKYQKKYTFVDLKYVFCEYKSEIIEKILDRQHMCIEKKTPINLMIIFDDCLNNHRSIDKPLLELLFNARCYKITYIITCGYPLLPVELRSNFDYVFLFHEDYISNQKRLYDHYAGMFPTFETFRQILLELTNNHSALVINNRKSSNSFYEKIFWYRATIHEKLSELPSLEIIINDKENDKTKIKNTENKNKDIINIVNKSNLEIAKYMLSNETTDKLLKELLLKVVSHNEEIINILTK